MLFQGIEPLLKEKAAEDARLPKFKDKVTKAKVRNFILLQLTVKHLIKYDIDFGK